MVLSPKRKKAIQLAVSPTVAIVCSVVLGGSYFGLEAYKYHNSYHDINGIWQVCFKPNQTCQQLIIQNINEAKESIRTFLELLPLAILINSLTDTWRNFNKQMYMIC